MKKLYPLIHLTTWFLLLNSCVSPLPPKQTVNPPVAGSSNNVASPTEETVPIEKRFALLIGNQAYQIGPLESPHNDVDDMAKSLEEVGFRVRTLKDQNLWEMKQAIRGFGELLEQDKNSVGLFYFSGHGMQDKEKNFLFPIGAMASVAVPGHLETETLNIDYLLAGLEGSGNRLNLVFLDACRDNPLSNRGFKSGKTELGLAPMQAPSGSLIAYATGANRTALDGRGQRNSPYAQHLKQEILKPGVSIFDMLTNVRVAVKKETNEAQEPAFYSNLDGKFCFKGPCGQIAPKTITRQPGTIFQDRLKDGSLGPEMVWIPAGTFQMGDIQGGGESDERPVHQVSIAQFAIGRYEITVGEFRQFVNATGYKTDAEKGGDCQAWDGQWQSVKNANWHDPKFSQKNNHPVVCVSWNDVNAYARWLSEQTGQNYRLPTEAEWEYAARAGTNTKYWWGNEIGANQANCHNDHCKDNFEYTAPVGSFMANPFGLYDTAGNVWEWTCSEYENRYEGKEKRCVSDAGLFALRGGSWGDDAGRSRAANRGRGEPTYRDDYLGARLARQ
jgi:formylglycine-generating enzyme required for sulfatase activity